MYFLRLKRRGELPDRKRDTEAIFAAEDGTLKHMGPDGSVSNLAGAGSLPDVGEEGDVLTVVDGEWAPEAPSGGSQPFSPLDLNGQVGLDWNPLTLSLWLDASDTDTITESGGKVSAWADKSGQDNHATQAMGANQPTTGATIGGLNALTFDGAATFMDTPFTNTDAATFVACVFKAGAVDLDSFNYAIVSSDVEYLQLNNNADEPQFQDSGSSALDIDPTVAHVGGLAQGGPGEVLWLDGTPQFSGSSGSWAGSAPVEIGAQGGVDRFWLGEIAEVVFVSGGSLTPEQQQNVFDYLIAKWGIS